jgi:hypothetical protein
VPDRPPIQPIETAAQLENAIHEMTINDLKKLWGGRLPRNDIRSLTGPFFLHIEFVNPAINELSGIPLQLNKFSFRRISVLVPSKKVDPYFARGVAATVFSR